MVTQKIIINIFSNWVNMLISIVISFLVSPIMVNQLGNEAYGIWVLAISLVNYFTVLDFGVNTAVVRYISKYFSAKDFLKAQQIYSSAFAFFTLIGIASILAFAVFSFYFPDIFSIKIFSKDYLYFVFFLVGINLALNLIYSVFLGALTGLQHFVEINLIAISTNIGKNIILVCLLLNDYSLLSIAILQLLTSLVKFFFQYLFLKKNYPLLTFEPRIVNRSTLKKIYTFSVYSFIMAIATKVLFYTDSIVIGYLLEVSGVTFYAIPAMIMEYLEKFIWAIIAVLIPVISSLNSKGDVKSNVDLYYIGTRYSLLISAPAIIVLFVVGRDFIALWMGQSYAEPSGTVLNLLLVGYFFYLIQLIAHGILISINRHKVLAYFMIAEAMANLILSIYLAPKFNIAGVALGTVVPMLIINIIALPMYSCHVLRIGYLHYVSRSILPGVMSVIIIILFLLQFDIRIKNYYELLLFIVTLLFFYVIYAWKFHVEKQHQRQFLAYMKKYTSL